MVVATPAILTVIVDVTYAMTCPPIWVDDTVALTAVVVEVVGAAPNVSILCALHKN